MLNPIWRLPLHAGYRNLLDSDIADLNNAGAKGRYGGAIYAGLFLQAFLPDEIPWLHFDIMEANIITKPGRPKGGETRGLRACFDYISSQFK